MDILNFMLAMAVGATVGYTATTLAFATADWWGDRRRRKELEDTDGK